jgi:hypothetical protein
MNFLPRFAGEGDRAAVEGVRGTLKNYFFAVTRTPPSVAASPGHPPPPQRRGRNSFADALELMTPWT